MYCWMWIKIIVTNEPISARKAARNPEVKERHVGCVGVFCTFSIKIVPNSSVSYRFRRFLDVPSEHFSVPDAMMEQDRGVVLASERYGRAECWKYVANDGGIERRREGGEGESRGNSVVGAFKVSAAAHARSGCPAWFDKPNISNSPFRVCFCLKATPRVSAATTCSISSGTLCRWGAGIKLSPVTLRPVADGFSRFLQAFFSSLSGTLATRASLRGVGVGNQEATVAAATMTWLLKGEP